MSGDDHKKLSQRALELWQSNNPDRPEDIVAGSYQNHQEPDVAGGRSTRDRRGWKEVLKSYHEDVLGESYENPDAAGGRSTRDLKGWKQLLKSYHQAFSNSRVDILSQIAEDQMVATRWRVTADHTGEFAGLAPTQKRSTWTGVSTDRFENGKIVESWVNWDKYSFLEGLGLVRINRR